ncbi:unnamed protein product [Auanema sp. JU1783]|nr:unnamed protein product [Auanema sp. JU1783]
MVQFINENQNFWIAEKHERFSTYSEFSKKSLMGVKNIHLPIEAKQKLSVTRYLNLSIPDEFDARTWWPQCESIQNIRDQSSCGSCWAFGAAEAITDRVCIASNGLIKPKLAADDLLACCSECGEGCNGGYPNKAWDYWVETGLVSGGDYGDNSTCLPYPFPSCGHIQKNDTHYDTCKHGLFKTPKCTKKCASSYHKDYHKDKHYGLSSYGVANNVEAIQKELMTYGPVEVAFEVYTDFMNYKSGVYKHVTGELAGGHAVKLIGWGEQNDVPYWLVANSWSTDWGEKGFFKILRGNDECGIEGGVVAGIPKVN